MPTRSTRSWVESFDLPPAGDFRPWMDAATNEVLFALARMWGRAGGGEQSRPHARHAEQWRARTAPRAAAALVGQGGMMIAHQGTAGAHPCPPRLPLSANRSACPILIAALPIPAADRRIRHVVSGAHAGQRARRGAPRVVFQARTGAANDLRLAGRQAALICFQVFSAQAVPADNDAVKYSSL